MGELNLKRACCVYEILFGSLVPLGAGRFSRSFSEMLMSLFSTLMLCDVHPNVTSDCILCVCTCFCSIHFKRAWLNMSVESPDTWTSFKWCQLISVSPWIISLPTSQKWSNSNQTGQDDLELCEDFWIEPSRFKCVYERSNGRRTEHLERERKRREREREGREREEGEKREREKR